MKQILTPDIVLAAYRKKNGLGCMAIIPAVLSLSVLSAVVAMVASLLGNYAVREMIVLIVLLLVGIPIIWFFGVGVILRYWMVCWQIRRGNYNLAAVKCTNKESYMKDSNSDSEVVLENWIELTFCDQEGKTYTIGEFSESSDVEVDQEYYMLLYRHYAFGKLMNDVIWHAEEWTLG